MSELAKQSLENLNIISGVVCYKAVFECVPHVFPRGTHRPHHDLPVGHEMFIAWNGPFCG